MKELNTKNIPKSVLFSSLIFFLIAFIVFNISNSFSIDSKKEYGATFEKYAEAISGNIIADEVARSELLYSARALFESSDSVMRNEWQTYSNAHSLRKSDTDSPLYPLYGLFYAPRVLSRNLNSYVAGVRNDKTVPELDLSKYTVISESTSTEYYPINYLETREGEQSLLGFDISSVVSVNKILNVSLKNDVVKFTLATKLGMANDAYLIYVLPLFKNGSPHSTAEERDMNLIGYIGALYKKTDIYIHNKQVFGELLSSINLKVIDGADSENGSLLYESKSKSSVNSGKVPLFSVIKNSRPEGSYYIQFSSTPELDALVNNDLTSRLVIYMGILFAFLSAIYAYTLLDARRKAEDLAGIITKDLREKEVVLEQSEADLKNVIFGSNAGTWDWYIKTGKVTFNERWAEILGYTLAELEPVSIKTWETLAHPDDLKESDRLLNEHFEGKTEFYSFDSRMKHKDGSWVWVTDRGRVVEWDEAHKPVRMTGTHIDITKLKEIQKSLEESEEKFRALFERSSAVMLLINPDDGNIIDANQAAENFYGWTISQLKEMSIRQINTLDPNVVSRHMEEATQAKNVLFEFKHKRADGSVRDVEVFSNGIVIGGKKVLFSIISDITKRKNAEESLAIKIEELQQFREAVSNASDHIVISDVEGKIIYANKGAEQMTGYSKEEMIGKTPAIWGGQMPKKFYEELWHQIKELKQPFAGEITNKRKNGLLYESEVSITPIINIEGNIEYFVGVERDITKAKQIDRSKSEFVSVASHQLRTPLTAINWYSEMLLSGDAGKLNKKQNLYVSEVNASSMRMSELVTALLDVSRIELGTFSSSPKELDIIQVADSVIKEIQVNIKARNQKVIKEYGAKKIIEIMDQTLVRMIIQNLMTNSTKYTKEGGQINLSINKNEKEIEIKVKDNGYGIPLNQQDKVYNKFFRGENITQYAPDGTGLGLYITKQMVEKVGGNISFISEEGKGTEFTVKLPVIKE